MLITLVEIASSSPSTTFSTLLTIHANFELAASQKHLRGTKKAAMEAQILLYRTRRTR